MEAFDVNKARELVGPSSVNHLNQHVNYLIYQRHNNFSISTTVCLLFIKVIITL